jgi:hypothetical protein
MTNRARLGCSGWSIMAKRCARPTGSPHAIQFPAIYFLSFPVTQSVFTGLAELTEYAHLELTMLGTPAMTFMSLDEIHDIPYHANTWGRPNIRRS